MMRKALLVSLAATALSLSGCGGAQDESLEANEVIGGDSNTMGEAVSDVEAAEQAAGGGGNEVLADNVVDTPLDANEIME